MLADPLARLERHLLLLDLRGRQGRQDLAVRQGPPEQLLLFQDRPVVQGPQGHPALQDLPAQRERALIFL